MPGYKQTLSLIDQLIAKLEANTGGEPILPSQRQSQPQPQTTAFVSPQQIQKKVKNTEKTEVSEKKEQAEKKEGGKKSKGEGRKPAAKEQEKVNLPEGVDPDVLIFAEVDLRVSEIVECWKHPASENLYCQKILVGNEVREIASGLQKFVPLEGMKGKVIVMANLKPRPLAGFNSNGMVVCASNPEHTKVELLVPEGLLGERLFLEGAKELFVKQVGVVKKSQVLEKVMEHFRTDDQGWVVWKGYKLRTNAGYIRSTILNGKVS